MPLFVVTYRKSKLAGYLLQAFLIIASVLIIMYFVVTFKFTVGLISLENYYLNGLLLNKPYCKMGNYAIGAILAYIYMDILEYRKIKMDILKKKRHPWIYWIHQ